MLAQIWPIQAVTEIERATVSGLVSLIEGRRGVRWSEMDSRGGLESDFVVILCAWKYICVCFYAVLDHFYTISECLPRRWTTGQAGRFVRREPDWCGTAAGAKPAETVRTGQTGGLSLRVCGLLLSALGVDPYLQSCLLCPPYLCHLWLQHQRLRTHPRNVYMDLTVTRERRVLDTHTHTHTHTHTFTLMGANAEVPL